MTSQEYIMELARRVSARRLGEQDLLVAQFILANPDVPIENIELTERRHQTGTSWTVGLRGLT